MRYTRYRLDPRLAAILGPLGDTPTGRDLRERLTQLVEAAPASPVDDELEDALRAHRWVLDHAADGGLALTAAGYLKPVDVVALSEVLPTMQDWIFSITREVDVHPLHRFRVSMQGLGLLRKYKGALVLTKSGTRLRDDPVALWEHLRDQLVPGDPPFAETAGIVVLLHAATSPGGRADGHAIADTMGLLGWVYPGGRPVIADDVSPVWNELWTKVGNVGSRPAETSGPRLVDRTLSDVALSLVRDALVTQVPLYAEDA
ncbi:hypothetical protein GCM10027026_40010 [Myroides odoratimimus subsp. xuanwuensis]